MASTKQTTRKAKAQQQFKIARNLTTTQRKKVQTLIDMTRWCLAQLEESGVSLTR